MRGDRGDARPGPWRAPREVLELLDASAARGLLAELHEARLELARAFACVAFGLGWLALHVVRAPGVIGVVVEVVLVELAVIGAAALLVLEARTVNANAYARAQSRIGAALPITTPPAFVGRFVEKWPGCRSRPRARTLETIRRKNLEETPKNGPPGENRSGAPISVPPRTLEPRRSGARAFGSRRDRFDLGRLDEHDPDHARLRSHEEVLEVVRGGDLVHRSEAYADRAAGASPVRGRFGR